MDQLEFDLEITEVERKIIEEKSDSNPMIVLHGYGNKDKKCKHCTHLFKKQYAGTYYKCGLRNNTNGAGTDHRVNWKSCGKFENKELK